MKPITARDLRRRRLEMEVALQGEDEILITRRSKPFAKLVRFNPPKAKRKRWNAEEHMKWMKKVYGNKVRPSIDAELAAARADRILR